MYQIRQIPIILKNELTGHPNFSRNGYISDCNALDDEKISCTASNIIESESIIF